MTNALESDCYKVSLLTLNNRLYGRYAFFFISAFESRICFNNNLLFALIQTLKLEGLRQQTQAAQDALVKGQQELIELHRELQECAQERDRQRKEALDQRRLLGDESREREAVQSSNQELRVFVKRAESENKR